MLKKQKIAVVFNEASAEFYIKPDKEEKKEINFIPFFEVNELNPIEEYELLAQRLCEAGYDAYTLNIRDDITSLIKDAKKNKPDCIFNFIELYKENARLEMNAVGVIDLLRIPYTGASPLTLANCQNKVLAKRILKIEGIRTSNFVLIKEAQSKYNHNLKFPVIVKPAYEDASVGIDNDAVVHNDKDLKRRIEYILFDFAQPALVEEYIDGRELNVAIIGDKHPMALPISEIDFSQMPAHLHNIVSYQAKWDPNHEAYHKTIPICPAILPPEVERAAKSIALQAFTIMGCRDYARIDIRLSKDNQLYVLEVNPNPDLTEGAGFLRSTEAAGYTYVQTLEEILRLALLRGA
jgi:D-alanine-D-alanine ligase